MMTRPRSARFMGWLTLFIIVLGTLTLYHLSGQIDGAAGVTEEQVAGMRKEAQRRDKSATELDEGK